MTDKFLPRIEAEEEHRQLERGIQATRWAGYARMVLGMIGAIAVTLFIVDVTIVHDQHKACMLETRDRLEQAAKDANDAIGEGNLSYKHDSGYHSRRARAAAEAALQLAVDAGLDNSTIDIDSLATMSHNRPDVLVARREFCSTSFPSLF